MNNIVSKKTIASNIKYQMEKKGITNKELCKELDFKYTTFIDWINAKTYPRIDKIEIMAKYFGCLKSELIEEQTDEKRQQRQDNKEIARLSSRMMTDNDFFEAVKAIDSMDNEKLSGLLKFVK